MFIKTKKAIIDEFKYKMNAYRSFVCGYDVDDAARLRMFHQAAGVFCTYVDLFPKYADEISDLWYDDYYPAMEKVTGDFYYNEKE